MVNVHGHAPADLVVGFAHVDSKRTVYIPVTKRSDASTLDVIRNVRQALPAMRNVAPEDVKIDLVFDQSLDEKTRTMPVELDVKNADLRLGAGMYPEVQWPVRRPQPSLLVPPTSIVTTTERTFVIRVKNGTAEWVNVGRGARVGDPIEVFGGLKDGDTIIRRGTDEIREGSKVNVQAKASSEALCSPPDAESSPSHSVWVSSSAAPRA